MFTRQRRFAIVSLSVAVSLVLGVHSTANAQPQERIKASTTPIPLESFWRNSDMAQAELSPSGDRIAALVNVRERVALVVIDLKTKIKPLVVANYPDADIRSFEWVGNDKLVYSLIDLQTEGSEQTGGPGLWVVKADGTERRALIRSHGSQTDRRLLNWNHSLLAVPKGRPDEVLIGQFTSTGAGELRAIVPLRLNVVTQSVESLGVGMPSGATGWIFDPHGEPRVASVVRKGMVETYWRGPHQKDWGLLTRQSVVEEKWIPHSVDGKGNLYVLEPEGEAGTAVLKRYDFERNAPETSALVATPGFDVDGGLIWGDKGQVLGVSVNTDAEATVWLDPKFKNWQAKVDEALAGRVNKLTCRRCDDEDPVVFVKSWSDRNPGEYWLYYPKRVGGQAWDPIGPVRGDIDAEQMATVDFFRVKARDGLSLPVWLTLPKGAKPGDRRPAIMLVHGGPWVRGGNWKWDGEAQFFASRGYVVIEPEFRGSTGYGARHTAASRKQWGLRMQDDLTDVLDWAVEQGYVDNGRVCIAGGSYGGYAALMSPIRYPDRYRCSAAWVAVTEPRLLLDLNDAWTDVNDTSRRYSLPVLLGDPVKDAKLLEEASPLAQAAKLKIPVLLAFGGSDRRVPLKHGTRMREALVANGHQPEWVVYAGEGHGWLKPQNRFDFARRLERFFALHLQESSP